MKKTIIAICLSFALIFGAVVPQAAAAADVTVTVDGTRVQFDQQPVIENGRVLVPIRALGNALGAEIEWIASQRQMYSIRGDDILWLEVDNHWMLTNDAFIYLDVPPRIYGSRILVPVRAISEGYGANVVWDGATRSVTVTTNGSTATSDYAYAVFELTNAERAKAGLQPLTWNDDLAEVAWAHSRDMAVRSFFDHTNPDGLSPFDRMDRAGLSYRRAAENIAAGYSTPAQVVDGWMNSPGHRANILDPNLKELGVGYYAGGSYGAYWTQCFMTAW